MTIYTPYTYVIGWPSENVWYYGVRYAKKNQCLYETGCHPDELWVTYFTSSKTVKTFVEKHGDPEIIQIRKTFTNEIDAIQWERKVLKRLKVIQKDFWLNENDSEAIYTSNIKNKGSYFWNNGMITIRAKEAPDDSWNRGMYLSDTQRKEKSVKNSGENNPFYGKTHTEEVKAKLSASKTGKNNPFYGKKRPDHSNKMKVVMKGKPKTQEHKDNISKSHNKVYVCPHCNKSGGRIMLRWHFDKCKHKTLETII